MTELDVEPQAFYAQAGGPLPDGGPASKRSA